MSGSCISATLNAESGTPSSAPATSCFRTMASSIPTSHSDCLLDLPLGHDVAAVQIAELDESQPVKAGWQTCERERQPLDLQPMRFPPHRIGAQPCRRDHRENAEHPSPAPSPLVWLSL